MATVVTREPIVDYSKFNFKPDGLQKRLETDEEKRQSYISYIQRKKNDPTASVSMLQDAINAKMNFLTEKIPKMNPYEFGQNIMRLDKEIDDKRGKVDELLQCCRTNELNNLIEVLDDPLQTKLENFKE